MKCIKDLKSCEHFKFLCELWYMKMTKGTKRIVTTFVAWQFFWIGRTFGSKWKRNTKAITKTSPQVGFMSISIETQLFFTIVVDVTYCNWCIIKMVLVMDPWKWCLLQSQLCHLNKLEKKKNICAPSIVHNMFHMDILPRELKRRSSI